MSIWEIILVTACIQLCTLLVFIVLITTLVVRNKDREQEGRGAAGRRVIPPKGRSVLAPPRDEE